MYRSPGIWGGVVIAATEGGGVEAGGTGMRRIVAAWSGRVGGAAGTPSGLAGSGVGAQEGTGGG